MKKFYYRKILKCAIRETDTRYIDHKKELQDEAKHKKMMKERAEYDIKEGVDIFNFKK